MKKLIAVILLALVSGISFSLLIFKKYEDSQVNKEINTVYVIQQGVYSNYNNMLKNTDKLEAYTYEKNDGKYYVYVCFTTNKDNIPMIEKYFKSLKYNVYVKEKNITDYRFVSTLKEYDYMLESINKESTVKNICKQLVNKYEEIK